MSDREGSARERAKARRTPAAAKIQEEASVLDPYLPYLLERWNGGCRSAKRLHAEIRERG